MKKRAVCVHADKITRCTRILHEVHRSLPILKSVRWKPNIRDRFFATNERVLPKPRYAPHDPTTALEQLREVRRLAPRDDVYGPWIRKQAATLSTTARMLAAVGTPAFGRHSRDLYGVPKSPFPGTKTHVLSLAKRLVRTWDRVSDQLPCAPPPELEAEEAAERISAAVGRHFGKSAPRVVVVQNLAARASAATKRIRLRAGTRFSEMDVRQLVQHEALVHVATALNGRAQKRVPVLAANHAGTTRTQEGLAVFAELISGTLDPRRLLRIAHRVIAIQMAVDGADFFDVYRYFLDHSPNRMEAFESAARVFRGGLVGGGATFTKDMVYLDGLCRVHVFVRAVIDTGNVDCLELLFAGKLDLDDIPTLMDLRNAGMCRTPRFVPVWVSDPRRLVAYFAVTDVIGRASTAGLREHYRGVLEQVPRVRDR